MAVQTTPFRRASIASYQAIGGGLLYAPVDQLRNQHYQAGILQPPLIEPAVKNWAVQTEDFSSVSWGKANVSVNPNAATAPDGNVTADILTRTSTTLNAQVTQTMNVGLVVAGITYTLSFFAKPNTTGNQIGLRLQSPYPTRMEAVFDLALGTIKGTNVNGWSNVSALITSVVSGWYRCTVTATALVTSANSTLLICPTDASRSVGSFEGFTSTLCDAQCWGVMVEIGAFATSYFPNTGAGDTRAADIDQMFGATDVAFTRQIGSWIAEGFTPGMQITPAGYADNAVAVVRDVSQLTLDIAGVRTIEAAVPGRSLTGVAPAYVPSVPTGGGTMPSRGTLRGARTRSTSHSQHSSLGTKRRRDISKRLHEAGVAEDPAEEQQEPTRAETPNLVLEHEAPAPIAIARPLALDVAEEPEAAPAVIAGEDPDTAMLRRMVLAAPTIAPPTEDEAWLDDLPSVVAAIDEDDRRIMVHAR